jgi:hypothetical protein
MAILHSSWALGLPVAACAASAADQSGRYRPSCRSAARADSVRLSRPKVACTSGVQAFYYIRHPRPFTAAATPGVMPPPKRRRHGRELLRGPHEDLASIHFSNGCRH